MVLHGHAVLALHYCLHTAHVVGQTQQKNASYSTDLITQACLCSFCTILTSGMLLFGSYAQLEAFEFIAGL